MKNILCKTFLSAILFITTFLCYANEPWSVRFADSEINRRPDRYGNWDYVTGTVLRGFEEVWRQSGNQKYYDYIKRTIDHVLSEEGVIHDYDVNENNIDEVAEARLLLMLYEETGEEKYKIAATSVRKQLDQHPRTSEGGFWHKQIYPWQMWLDGLYMGSPFYTEYSVMFNQPEYLDDITKQFVLIKKHLYDPESELFYHAWDESREMFWANKETGLSQCFWGRGLGWYAMALVDVLEDLPKDYEGRNDLIEILNLVASGIKKHQDAESGLWWQVLDQGDREGNYLEGSVSTMFVYALAKGVRLGALDTSYYKVAKKGFDGIIKHLIIEDSNGNLNLARICRGAGLGGNYSQKIRDGSFEYYAYIEPIIPNDGKGTGPFMMAAVEIERAESK